MAVKKAVCAALFLALLLALLAPSGPVGGDGGDICWQRLGGEGAPEVLYGDGTGLSGGEPCLWQLSRGVLTVLSPGGTERCTVLRLGGIMLVINGLWPDVLLPVKN